MKKFDENSKVLIVGLGLIGGSIALAMRKLGYKNIRAIDINEQTIKFAVEQKIIEHSYLIDKELVAWADITIISLYPLHAIEFLEKHQGDFATASMVIDTSGIKEEIIRRVRSFWNNNADFITIHQMAGKEQGGIVNASAELFYNTNFIITPQPENLPEHLEFVEDFAKGLQVKGIYKLSAREHDKIIAYTSHLNHMIAVSLVNTDSFTEQTTNFIGGSFRDVSRVALINSNLWSQLLLANKEHALEELDKFKTQLERLHKAISNYDEQELRHILEQASANRSKLCR